MEILQQASRTEAEQISAIAPVLRQLLTRLGDRSFLELLLPLHVL